MPKSRISSDADQREKPDRRAAILRLVGESDERPRTRRRDPFGEETGEPRYPEAITWTPGQDFLSANVPARLRPDDVPYHLLTIPGVLGQAVDHYNATSTTTQPQFAVQTALALGSVICGRYWVSDHGNFTSLQLANLGPTGCGKEFAETFIGNALEEAGLDLSGPRGYASEAAVMGALEWQPRHIAVVDEFGMLLNSTQSGGSTNLRDARKILMSAATKLGTRISPQSYSIRGQSKEQIEAMRNARIVRPAITLLGLSTASTFFECLSHKDVDSGFLNRILVVYSDLPFRVEEPRVWRLIPTRLKRWMRNKGTAPDDMIGDPGREDPLDVCEPTVVKFTAAALERLQEMKATQVEWRNHLREQELDGQWSRAVELAMRIALIVALSLDERTGDREDLTFQIDAPELNWAWDYVKFYTRRMVEHVTSDLGGSALIKITDHLAEMIAGTEGKGITMSQMCRRYAPFDKLTERERKEVVERLASVHQIEAAAPVNPKGGRPTKVYVEAKYISARKSQR